MFGGYDDGGQTGSSAPVGFGQPVTVEVALLLAAEPAIEIETHIEAAASVSELGGLRLAVCSHRDCGALARLFAARLRELQRHDRPQSTSAASPVVLR